MCRTICVSRNYISVFVKFRLTDLVTSLKPYSNADWLEKLYHTCQRPIKTADVKGEITLPDFVSIDIGLEFRSRRGYSNFIRVTFFSFFIGTLRRAPQQKHKAPRQLLCGSPILQSNEKDQLGCYLIREYKCGTRS